MRVNPHLNFIASKLQRFISTLDTCIHRRSSNLKRLVNSTEPTRWRYKILPNRSDMELEYCLKEMALSSKKSKDSESEGINKMSDHSFQVQ